MKKLLLLPIIVLAQAQLSAALTTIFNDNTSAFDYSDVSNNEAYTDVASPGFLYGPGGTPIQVDGSYKFQQIGGTRDQGQSYLFSLAASEFSGVGITDEITLTFNITDLLNSTTFEVATYDIAATSGLSFKFGGAVDLNASLLSDQIGFIGLSPIDSASFTTTGLQSMTISKPTGTNNIAFAFNAFNNLSGAPDANDNTARAVALVDNISVQYGPAGIVPEPSAYALLSGLCAIGFVAARRRRRSV